MSDILPTVITGGLGAAIGSIGTAVVQTVSGRGVSRAEAVDRVTNAAGNLADRQDKQITRLEAENIAMRKAMVALAEAVEDLLPIVDDEAVRDRVHAAIATARVAFR